MRRDNRYQCEDIGTDVGIIWQRLWRNDYKILQQVRANTVEMNEEMENLRKINRKYKEEPNEYSRTENYNK